MTAFQKKIGAPRPQPVIVLFYMEMCPHCVMMKPAWRETKAALDPRTINIAEVEYSNLDKMPAAMQNIRGFPSIKVFRGTQAIDEYLGERTQEDMVKFIKKYATAPPAAPSTAKKAPTRARTSASKPTSPRKVPSRASHPTRASRSTRSARAPKK